jgi:GNAT superfamily N-acetyltransferase
MNQQSIVIRSLNSDDLKSVGEVVNRSMRPSLNGLPEETIQKLLARNDPDQFLKGRESVEYYVAEIEESIVGVIGLDKDEIRTFYVDPKFQGQGIGKQLFEKVKELAINRGFKTLTTKSSPVAEDIYKRLGFESRERIWKTHPDGNKTYTVIMKLTL